MAKIAIDAGHYLYTDGKRCLKSLDANETREWVLNDRVADALATYLESAGHTILRVDDVTGKKEVTLSERCRRANVWDADYYVSIHHNAGVNGGSGGGTVVYIFPNCGGKTEQAQRAIYVNAVKRANLKGNRSSGLAEADFQVLRESAMPASLVECGFMDSSTDIKYILNPEWSKKIALGIAEGICEVFGGTVKETVKTPEKAPEKASGKLYRVQVGAFSKKENAEAMLTKLKSHGFDGYIKES